MAKRLHNYLLTHRKRFGLTQAEVAFLLGCRHKTKVSDYEQRTRRPMLETALACEVVFGVPVRELFAGMFDEVEVVTHRRGPGPAPELNPAAPNPPHPPHAALLVEISP